MSQKSMFDGTWIFGYPDGIPHPKIGGTLLKFNREGLNIDTFNIPLDFVQRTTFSDSLGNLLFYSGGCDIANFQHKNITNDFFNLGEIHDDYCPGYPYAQAIIALPNLYKTNQPTILYLNLDYSHLNASELRMGQINFENVPKGEIVFYDSLLVKADMTEYLVANKHANGKDWWVLLQKLESNEFVKILLGEFGVISFEEQAIGPIWDYNNWSGQACFSPDGTKYARTSPENGIDLFDFNRCNGQLSNSIHIDFQLGDTVNSCGVSFSPSNQFMYVSATLYVYQYDLWSDNVSESQTIVATYDGFSSIFWTPFYQHKLGIDNKIYISAPSGVEFLHVINEPDKKGVDCRLEQHSIDLINYNGFAIPNMPNYRLGPIDGSLCDTSGLNNIPQAYYHYKFDSLERSQVYFQNLSYFEPETYFWRFGDGETSNLENPIHTYSSGGEYQVCLTAQNSNGETTDCYDISIDFVNSVAEDERAHIDFQVYPNPSDGILNLKLDNPDKVNSISIINSIGQRIEILVKTSFNSKEVFKIEKPGIYYIQVILKNGTSQTRPFEVFN